MHESPSKAVRFAEVASPPSSNKTKSAKKSSPTHKAQPPPQSNSIPKANHALASARWEWRGALLGLGLLCYLLLCVFSPFLSHEWADRYRGNSPPYLSNSHGEMRFNRLLQRRGFDGKMRPEKTEANYFSLVQPYSDVWRADESDRSSTPLLKLRVIAPSDGMLVNGDFLEVEVSGALLREHYSARPAVMEVLLDGQPRLLAGDRFSLPFEETAFTLRGTLGGRIDGVPEVGNGLHQLTVSIVAMQVPGAARGDSTPGNVSVSTTTVFYLWRPPAVDDDAAAAATTTTTTAAAASQSGANSALPMDKPVEAVVVEPMDEFGSINLTCPQGVQAPPKPQPRQDIQMAQITSPEPESSVGTSMFLAAWVRVPSPEDQGEGRTLVMLHINGEPYDVTTVALEGTSGSPDPLNDQSAEGDLDTAVLSKTVFFSFNMTIDGLAPGYYSLALYVEQAPPDTSTDTGTGTTVLQVESDSESGARKLVEPLMPWPRRVLVLGFDALRVHCCDSQ